VQLTFLILGFPCKKWLIGYERKGCALLFEVNQKYTDRIWFDGYRNTEIIDKVFDYISKVSEK